MTLPGKDKVKIDAKQSLDKSMKWLGQNNFAKHMAAGTASGWVTGSILGHASKSIAIVVGSGILIAQVAQHKGYLSDWNVLKETAEKKSHEVGAKLGQSSPAINKVKGFATKNKTFTAAFIGGLLLGVAT